MATSVRRTVLTLPAAPLGPENPLPALRPLDEVHRVGDDARAALPAEAARQIGYGRLRSVLPVRLRDGYGRRRAPCDLDAIVIENDRLRATVLPGLGGRIHSLHHKPTDRELLYRNPVFQPADFALNGAWFSGGIEWNIGATGHGALSCAPLHAARVAAPDGGEMVRLWEWERLRDLPFQVDLWLPDGSDFLHVGVRIRNPHDHRVPVYWWSNTAVPETGRTRVLVPADAAWHFGYRRDLRHVPVPEWGGADVTYPLRGEHAADYFYEVPDTARRWIAAVDGDGHGLVQTSTDLLRGRKLFAWGAGAGGRHWQRWLTEPGTGGYAEIQAGLARTQLEHLPLEAGQELSWLEAYGPVSADPAAVHGADWAAARAAVEVRLAADLPRAAVDAAYAAWLPCADNEPKETLATGSGWGALEAERAGFDLPGTPFDPATQGAEQEPWRALLRTGALPEWTAPTGPGASLVAPPWRELLETAPSGAAADFHLGVAQWHAGDRAQAARSWERSLLHAETPWTLRCLAVADAASGHTERAADRLLRAVRLVLDGALYDDAAPYDAPSPPAAAAGPYDVALEAALAREAVGALLAADRAADAGAVLDALRPAVRDRGRFRLLRAQVLLARGDAPAARALLDAGIEVADLREGDESLSDTWFATAERLVAGPGGAVTEEVRQRARAAHPLPEAYEYRMRPGGPAAEGRVAGGQAACRSTYSKTDPSG
ncbi:DUF5107 domain-containing protein [Streptomyces sp. XD-27]|uniref:DUF5107 domain-containing protein n=1 Tax=Streptomyces sp. XD-27 TaxID=3062779 RepID=UPI0026F439D7|nr:DUF5107 domain-containing protein [Streptomyces sp. XD-27]WKX73247.1 DUF5107 domain-containing protein [Streptomyces sp. XD-27]